MTILVTGAGLIGCHTAKLLLESGRTVVLLDNNPAPAAIASILSGTDVLVERVDIRDFDALLAVLRMHRIERVLHTAAALSLAFNANPPLGAAVNVVGTVNLLEACRQAGVARVVFGSSTTVAYSTFHREATAPILENFALRVVEDRPGSFYAASKLSGEFFGHLYADRYGVSVGILRYAAVLGLWGGPNNSVPGRLITALLSGKAGDRIAITDPLLLWSGGDDFIDARDVATANVAALEAASLPARVYFIASGNLTSLPDFVRAAQTFRPSVSIDLPALPPTGFAGFPHQRTQPFDIGAAARDLGFRPAHDIASSLEAALLHVSGAS
jgi:UDP-glucose 4-epimerase